MFEFFMLNETYQGGFGQVLQATVTITPLEYESNIVEIQCKKGLRLIFCFPFPFKLNFRIDFFFVNRIWRIHRPHRFTTTLRSSVTTLRS